jgi:hypothetical protein
MSLLLFTLSLRKGRSLRGRAAFGGPACGTNISIDESGAASVAKRLKKFTTGNNLRRKGANRLTHCRPSSCVFFAFKIV